MFMFFDGYSLDITYFYVFCKIMWYVPFCIYVVMGILYVSLGIYVVMGILCAALGIYVVMDMI